MNTTTFCNAPLASAMTPWFKTGVGCCLAQLGSAAMLMGIALGTLPSNFTSPVTLAVPAPVVAELGGPPARTVCRLEIERMTATAIIRTRFFAFIQPLPALGEFCFLLLLRP